MLFDDQTDGAMRSQILTYFISQVMTDRERAKMLGLPEGTRIREGAKILGQDKFKCGHHVWIGEGAVLDALGGLEIGDYTQIGLNVMVWSHVSHWQALKSRTCVDRRGIIYQPTKIGNNCFIAGPSVIAPGVTIGDRCIVSPMSFVDKDLPDDTVFSNGLMRKELEDQVDTLKKVNTKLLGILQANQLLSAEDAAALLQEMADCDARKRSFSGS